MQRADQAGVIGMKADRHQVDLEILRFKDDVGAGDGEFADPALAEAAADHDALGVGPRLGLEESPRHIGQFLGELLDRAVHQRGGADVVAQQRLVEFALGDLAGGFLAQGVVAVLLQRLAQRIEDFAERALAGAVAQKSVVVLQLDIETVHLDRRQSAGAVVGDPRGADDVFCHVALPNRISLTQRAGNPLVHLGEWRMANGNGPSLFAIRHSLFAFSGQIPQFGPVFGASLP